MPRSDDRGLWCYRGKWYVRIAVHGRMEPFGAFPNKTAARNFRNKARAELAEERFFPELYRKRGQKTLTFESYAQHWFQQLPVRGMKTSTIHTYRYHVQPYLLPRFGAIPLRRLRRAMAKELAADLLGRGLSHVTVKAILLTLSAIFTQAVEDHLLEANPFLHVGKIIQAPRGGEEDEVEFFLPEQQQKILDTIKPISLYWYTFILLLFRSGTRIGEITAFHREDIDWHHKQIHVRRNWCMARISSPKGNRNRRVDLSDDTLDTLRQYLEWLDLESAMHDRPPTPILFPGVPGIRPNPRAGSRYSASARRFWMLRPRYMRDTFVRREVWYPLLALAKVPSLGLHAARHTFASHLIQLNVPLKYISEQLGHASIQTTADIYGHLFPSGQREWINRLDGKTPSA